MLKIYKTSDIVNNFVRFLVLPPMLFASFGFCFNDSQNALFVGLFFLILAIAIGMFPTVPSTKINNKIIILDEEGQKMTFQTPLYTHIIPFDEIEQIVFIGSQEILRNNDYIAMGAFNFLVSEHFRIKKKNSVIIDNIPLLSPEIIEILDKHTGAVTAFLKNDNLINKIHIKILGAIWILLSIILFFIIKGL